LRDTTVLAPSHGTWAARARRRWPLWLLEAGAIVFVAVYFIPVYAIIIISLKTTREIIYTPLAFPKALFLGNFVKVWSALNFGRVYINSVMISLAAVCLRITFASMASFTLAKKKNRFNEFLYILFLSGLMIPIYTVLVPIVKLLKDLGFMNSRLGLVIFYAGVGMPFAVFLLVGFVRTLPNELVEAAVIDGCTVYTIFWRLIFPLLKPAVTTLFILDFLGIWNDFLIPMLTLSDATKRTVTLAMYNFYGEYGSRWEMTFSAYTIAVVPLIIMYLLLQKNIVNGILVGAVKG
jgi:raffinose/stachyose/melibiose transport system permease protein